MILSYIPLDIAAFNIGDSAAPRAAGLHASDIYNDLYKALEPKRFDRPGGPPPILLETGLIFETALEEGLARRFSSGQSHEQIERPGELTYTGVYEDKPVEIHYNPDLFIYNGGFRIGEIKATWLSSKIEHEWLENAEAMEAHRDEIEAAFLNPKFDKYYTQLKLYSYFLKTKLGRLYICFIAGNYDRPFRTQVVPMDVEFNEDELFQNYCMCLNHAVYKGMI